MSLKLATGLIRVDGEKPFVSPPAAIGGAPSRSGPYSD